MLPKLLFSLVLLAIAIARYLKDPGTRGRFDTPFILLVSVAFLFPLLPLDRLKGVSAGGIEISLADPSVQAAVASVTTNSQINEQLRRRLEEYSFDLSVVAGARVLWIDGDPRTTIGAQRLLRALGMTMVMVTSSRAADKIFESDLDFDLIVSDIGRQGDSWQRLKNRADSLVKYQADSLAKYPADSLAKYEGINYLRLLRLQHRCVVADLPVVFFSGLDLSRQEQLTQDLRFTLPRVVVSDSVPDFVIKVVRQLGVARRDPPAYSLRKTPISSLDTSATRTMASCPRR